MAEYLLRGHLSQESLPHTRSNISDCVVDPGVLTAGEAVRVLQFHWHCSSRCRVRHRLAEQLGAVVADMGESGAG